MNARSNFYWLFLICLLSVNSNMFAQVVGRYDLEKSKRDSSIEINLSWLQQDEVTWKRDNTPKLEVMSVAVGLHSGELSNNRLLSTFSFSSSQFASGEYLIAVDKFREGEILEIRAHGSDRLLYSHTFHASGKFLTPQIVNDDAYWNWKSIDGLLQSEFTISHVYVHSGLRDIGFNTALPCHINAACHQDSLSQSMASSVVRMRMVMEEGIGWCTGSLVNNTRQDRKPYLLSAFHCQYEFTPVYDAWRFDFFYESNECVNPDVEPGFVSLTGCERIALRRETDFLLVLLKEQIPVTFPAVFAGWNADAEAIPDSVFLVHHPNADIKKRSISNVPVNIHPNQINWTEGYTTPAQHHFRVFFSTGGHQPGSSGAPLFNPLGQVVGQLHGGKFGCESQSNTYVGRMSMSWNQGDNVIEKLAPWLDPDNSGITQLEGLQNIDSTSTFSADGQVLDPFNRPVKNVRIEITGDTDFEVVTDENGNFTLDNLISGGNYTITPKKDGFDLNGINVLDVVAIQSHLLGRTPFHSTWQLIAADANKSNVVSVVDLLELQKLLLGFYTELPKTDSWRFFPDKLILQNVNPQQLDPISFTGIKVGDLNGTSDPSK